MDCHTPGLRGIVISCQYVPLRSTFGCRGVRYAHFWFWVRFALWSIRQRKRYRDISSHYPLEGVAQWVVPPHHPHRPPVATTLGRPLGSPLCSCLHGCSSPSAPKSSTTGTLRSPSLSTSQAELARRATFACFTSNVPSQKRKAKTRQALESVSLGKAGCAAAYPHCPHAPTFVQLCFGSNLVNCTRPNRDPHHKSRRTPYTYEYTHPLTPVPVRNCRNAGFSFPYNTSLSFRSGRRAVLSRSAVCCVLVSRARKRQSARWALL